QRHNPGCAGGVWYADGRASTGESVYGLYEPGALTPGTRYEKGQLHYVVRDHMGTPRELPKTERHRWRTSVESKQ
ncbi:TPA: hypothetical protein ACIO7U_004612, partial [Salmonella enterica subsp. enterica serovar Wangata]